MIKKKLLVGTALILMLSATVLSGCGKESASENAANEDKKSESSQDNSGDDKTNADDKTNDDADQNGSESFGLKDFDGFYYQSVTEEKVNEIINESYSVTYIYGYQFNADGTGMYYGQDTIDITWNETEIHTDAGTYNYTMEPGKLIVNEGQDNESEFVKASGKVIKPCPYNIDVNNVEDGIYPADFETADISEADGKYKLSAELYTMDVYDIADIGQMAAGDVLIVDGTVYIVDTINTLESGRKEINGGIEEMGTELITLQDSNGYVFGGFDDMRTYTNQGKADLNISDTVKVIYNSDPSESKEYTGTEAVNQLKTMTSDATFISEYNCRITVENGEVVEIIREYTP